MSNGRCYYCNEEVDNKCEGFDHVCNMPGKPAPSMTAYCWDGKGEDPNRDLIMCTECAKYHIEDMNNQWDDYYYDKIDYK